MKHSSIRTTIAVLALALLATLVPCLASAQTVSPQGPIPAAEYFAIKYNYGGFAPAGIAPQALFVDQGNSATGTGTITVRVESNIKTFDGRVFMPFATNAPIIVDSGTNQETVTPTAVSCGTPTLPGTCQITASFSNIHGTGSRIASGTFGLQEAINDANAQGGGTVWIDQAWVLAGGTTTIVKAVTSTTPKVWVADVSGPGPITWFGKSGTGSAAYSASNNDIVFSGASPLSKTFSQTYSVAPVCVGSGTAGAATAVTSTTTTASATCTGTCTVHCAIVK